MHRGYADRPVTKAPNWHGLVAMDTLFNNMSTGLFLVAALGELSAPDVINVPEQTMGGAPGTARITYTNGRLTYAQSGLGITCGGSDYVKVA